MVSLKGSGGNFGNNAIKTFYVINKSKHENRLPDVTMSWVIVVK